jgi:hypothetical protein
MMASFQFTAAPAVCSPHRAQVLDLIDAHWTTQVVSTAAALRLMDLMKNEPRSVQDLAVATGCAAPALHRLMNALVALGLCVETARAMFTATAAGELLRSDAEGSLRAWAQFSGTLLWCNWSGLHESVRTGKSERMRSRGTEDFSHLDADPAAAALFHQAMVDLTRPVADALLKVMDFGRCGRVADIGGGTGHLLATILTAHPRVHGILFDLEHAIAGARPWLAERGVADRCELVAGSFFERFPTGPTPTC